MSRLTDLLRQARKAYPQLGADLEAEIATLTKRRTFGLVFEQHQPEAVELPSRGVRRGDKVRVLPPRGESTEREQRLWRVLRIEQADGSRLAHLEELDAEEPESQVLLANDLVVVAQFRDMIYPGLIETGRVERGEDKPFHSVINGENFHALEMLTYTHPESVDLIYIDPPYNTGNDDWIYNDRHVSQDDDYRHSKWLAFMERRLKIARDLLKDTGVIIVAIGDAQHHRLRMLMDQVFHESNFLTNLVWQGGVKNDSRFSGAGLDYMLVYAKDAALIRTTTHWKEAKAGAEAVVASALQAFEKTGDEVAATVLHRKWLKVNKVSLDGVLPLFNTVVAPGRAARINGDLSFPGRGGPRYEVMNPNTDHPCKIPMRGWGWTEETMAQAISEGRVYFPKDDDTSPQGIAFLDERLDSVPKPSFTRERFLGSRHVEQVLGSRRFPYPKDHEVLMRWFRMAASTDATILDFFGGSGSTLEAVMRLNIEDGGTRQCILVTNNEVGARESTALRKAGHRKGDSEWEAKGVYEYVTRPRITTVVTGQRPDGSTYDNTVDANVEFFTLTYESPLSIRHNRAFERVAPMLWLRAGSQGRIITSLGERGWAVSETYGVLEDLDRTEAFLQAVAAQPSVRQAFVVTDDDSAFEMVCRDLPAGVTPVRLYESYLQNFEISVGRNR